MTSVVIPVRDGARYLAQAIESAQAQPEVEEIVVVDDGSSDDSAAIAEQMSGVTVLRGPKRGISAARNAGVAQTRGPVLAFLDADDVWLPGKLSLQLAAIERASTLALSFSWFELFVEPGVVLPRSARALVAGDVLRAPIPSTLVVSREAFARVGGFDEGLETAEDVDWFGRARASGVEAIGVERVLARKRLHASNTSLVAAGNTERLFTALRRRIS